MNDAWCPIYDEYLIVFVVFSAHVRTPILYTVWKVDPHVIIPALFLLVPVTAMLTLMPVYLLWLYTLFLWCVHMCYTLRVTLQLCRAQKIDPAHTHGHTHNTVHRSPAALKITKRKQIIVGLSANKVLLNLIKLLTLILRIATWW